MGKLLCEKNLRDVWCRNESVRAEIGHILQTHTQTHASKLVVEMTYLYNVRDPIFFVSIIKRPFTSNFSAEPTEKQFVVTSTQQVDQKPG